ncbi:GNAT family N-acetyltransferase [Kribbella albertanoniae]|uniref:GNAT family N-acetyltransferase n=1 Tax=Kribbella albertanoniae TaxID=1266829 RepID=A0A4R4P1A3_9ACTN|nr:GNAT family N-acetyltransferase [Kribbella albertanoniae]TDC14337.1 GNAT family N-acetyltransferase [Kribbella albertanoniae]
MGIQIRAATPDLLAAAVRKFMGAEPGRTYLDSPGTLAFVAADPEVLGWCWGYHLPRPDGTSMLYLHQFAVDENHRRRGIGKGLLRAFMTAGTRAGATKMFLTTGADNHPARSLYDALGGGLAEQGPTVNYWFVLDR